MITADNILKYNGPSMMRADKHLYVRPYQLLRPYISSYMLTISLGMAAEQTVLPTASNTLVFSIHSDRITGGLRGVNTKAVVIGNYASQVPLMLLIEFHPGGMYPFMPVRQNELTDQSYALDLIDLQLQRSVEAVLENTASAEEMIQQLDKLFIKQLQDSYVNPVFRAALDQIVSTGGRLTGKQLAGEIYYSQKQLNRWFQLYLGTNVKTFSRIVRVNHAMQLMAGPALNVSAAAEAAGHYDTAHFVRDFQKLCGITPGEYLARMSLFYNDPFKL